MTINNPKRSSTHFTGRQNLTKSEESARIRMLAVPIPNYTLERTDAGMGETEYRIFENGMFFSQVLTEETANRVIRAMKVLFYDEHIRGYKKGKK